MADDFQDKFIDNEGLASEDWRCLFIITLFLLVLSLLYILENKLNTPINCVPDYCFDNFCVILKEGK